MSISPKETAYEVLEVVPLVMRTVRTQMRSSRSFNLSVPQFRTLGFVHRHPGTSLSDVAEHVGLTLPSMCKLIDGLVERKLIARRSHPSDRRRITLDLTSKGGALLQLARESTQESLAERLSVLHEDDRVAIVHAMQILHQLFAHTDLKGQS
jgi:DNA-binding MarR family transcriptional regulator